MSRAFVLMTAMPPTRGHANLVRFASRLAEETVVIVSTQPDEPMPVHRFTAMLEAFRDRDDIDVRWLHRQIEQNPDAPGFWEMWRSIMRDEYGFKDGDLVVASEEYGKKLAEVIDGKFMPYDIDREILPIKATPVRKDLAAHFDEILPEFQRHLQVRVTIFGAESNGKTTLTRNLRRMISSYSLFEYARPYLENTVNEITVESMTDIWEGQRALQEHAYEDLSDKPFLFQDTDLFSTVGYWDFWRGDTPQALVEDAKVLRSDLYIILRSVIPFEQDPLRYGGDKRESDDQFWVDLAEKHKLNYVVIDSDDEWGKVEQALLWLDREWDKKAKPFRVYNRTS